METVKTGHQKKNYSVSFIDAEHNLAELEITIKDGQFSISGNYANCGGQVQDEIKPANDAQKELLKLWDKYHLNGMKAGTPEQEAAIHSKEFERFKAQQEAIKADVLNTLTERDADLKNYYSECHAKGTISKYVEKQKVSAVSEAQKKYDSVKETDHYTLACKFLAFKNLLIVPHPETGEPYKYGSEWLTCSLPDDIIEQVETVIEEINEAEEERKGEPLDKLTDEELIELIEEKTTFSGDEAELCAALVKMFDLSENDLEDIEIDGNRATVQGTEYLAGDDSAMDEEWDNELEYYIDECILPEVNENYRRYFDSEAWKSDARHDGRADSLNRYDGGEESAEINVSMYFAYRQ